jgi:ferredoxin
MAEKSARLRENAPGAYYVDSSCVDCDMCRSDAPSLFKRDDEIGISIVYRQPASAEEIALAEEAMQGCPTNSIGKEECSRAEDGVNETGMQRES